MIEILFERMNLAKKVTNEFKERFGGIPQIFMSPGRINIIGEHTDYNDGFVLPAAIDKGIYIAISKNDLDKIRLFSSEFNELFEFEVNNLPKSGVRNWTDYLVGVVSQIASQYKISSGFDVVIDGDIPIGSGLSSSAAVECATVFALDNLFNLELSKFEMVKIAQQAEHKFVGVKCGIMDMFASMFGEKDSAIRLDCRSLSFEYFPLKMEGYKFLLLNTNVKHNLASSAYNERRQQCEQGVDWINQNVEGVKALRDVNLQMLNDYVLPKDKLVYRRCKYIIEEINRVHVACEAMKNANFNLLGSKMSETHEGLSKEYEVSCFELDLMIELVKTKPEVLGSRMMGGGFGGCTINLVKESSIEKIVNEASEKYLQKTGKALDYYVVTAEKGTSKVY